MEPSWAIGVSLAVRSALSICTPLRTATLGVTHSAFQSFSSTRYPGHLVFTS